MRYRVLGPLTVADGESWVEITAAKPRATLALLLVRANESVSPDWLIEELWGGDASRSGRDGR